MGRRALSAALAVAVAGCAGTVAGCGLIPAGGPRGAGAATGAARGAATTATSGASSTGAGMAAAVARADRTHELPTPTAGQTVSGGWRSPVQAVEVFTATYVNWTAATVSERLRVLSEASIGQARSAMSLAAGETAHDYELRRGQIANSGVVEAIAPVRGTRGEYAVVTRELTTAANGSAYRGLEPTWHVTLATVARVDGGLWVLSRWQPEN